MKNGMIGVMAAVGILAVSAGIRAVGSGPELKLQRDDRQGRLEILIDGRPALVYRYSEWLDLPHYYPLFSPSGKNMLVQQTEPYPHHRAFWFADTVRLDGGRPISLYNAFSTGQRIGTEVFGPPFRDRIRHLQFTRLEVRDGRAEIECRLVWEADGADPVLAESRRLVVQALGRGEYFLDLTIILTAVFGELEFVSDEVHYAWPYFRMHPLFSGENGGLITSDTGARGEEATDMKPALWIDYSNTVEEVTEGLAVFQFPDGRVHRWLTREYGTFGPRRPDERSGRSFKLEKDGTLSQRVGVLVHRGDVVGGRVADRYAEFVSGRGM